MHLAWRRTSKPCPAALGRRSTSSAIHTTGCRLRTRPRIARVRELHLRVLRPLPARVHATARDSAAANRFDPLGTRKRMRPDDARARGAGGDLRLVDALHRLEHRQDLRRQRTGLRSSKRGGSCKRFAPRTQRERPARGSRIPTRPLIARPRKPAARLANPSLCPNIAAQPRRGFRRLDPRRNSVPRLALGPRVLSVVVAGSKACGLRPSRARCWRDPLPCPPRRATAMSRS
jgi:hypothetical protein